MLKLLGSDEEAAVPSSRIKPLVSLKDVEVAFPVHHGSSRSMQLEILELVGLKSHPHKKANIVRALRGISFDIFPGERVGILGHNGAGKTTLLRTIAGAYPPTKGTVKTRGRITSMTDFAMGMDPEATGRENIVFRGVFMGMTFSQINSRVDEVLEFSGLKKFADMPMRTYSTGMYLRLAFAVSTLEVPDILVLDEVINAGDLGFQERMEERLESFIGQSKAVVLSSHDFGALKRWCTRALWLRDGKIVDDGPVDNIIESYLVERR
jgi:ABC-type polysaccharide/polyol phosphate transport system ATPase subunit